MDDQGHIDIGATIIPPDPNGLVIYRDGAEIWRGDVQLLADLLERERQQQNKED